MFSAKLRLNGDIDRDTIEAYVDEVMDLVELTSIRGAIVSPFPSSYHQEAFFLQGCVLQWLSMSTRETPHQQQNISVLEMVLSESLCVCNVSCSAGAPRR